MLLLLLLLLQLFPVFFLLFTRPLLCPQLLVYPLWLMLFP